jgi:nucleotide-binding universal stress UspA family protein
MSYVEVGAWSGRRYPPNAVVVGYNGRPHSRAAVVWAAHEAARRGSPLVVLYAADYPGMAGPPGVGLLHREPGALEAAEEVTARGVAEAVATRPDLRVLGATEVTGPAHALVEAGEDASLVVVGSRGRGRLARAVLGSVAAEVSARATAPVVVVTGPRPRRSGQSADEPSNALIRRNQRGMEARLDEAGQASGRK